MSITAEQFYDLVALRFAARWDPDRIRTMHGKINAANWLFYRMGIYSEGIRSTFAKDLNVANLFVRKSSIYYVSTIPRDLEDEIWSEDKHFLIAVRPQHTFHRRQLLGPKGYTAILTAVGQEYATEIEDRYAPLFTREKLRQAITEQHEFFHVSRHARAKGLATRIQAEREAEGEDSTE